MLPASPASATPGADRRSWILPGVLALAFFVTHAFALPRTLEDLDSINFAMGVESFDVPAHQPHPPGYPLYIALGKVSTGVLHAVVPSWDRDRRAAVGLAIWGLIAGTLAPFVLVAFWRAIGFTQLLAALSAAVAITMPLFWFTAARPLSDVSGLVPTIAVQAVLVRALMSQPAASLPRTWLLTAAAAGLLVGFRTQTMWLTGPLLLTLAGRLILTRHARQAGALLASAAAGALVWAIPLIADSGYDKYINSLSRVGANDFEAIELVALDPSWRLLRQAVQVTFTVLWSTRGLAQVVGGLAIIGLVWMVLRRRQQLGLIALAFVPYLGFHVLFQEPANVRYAIPLAVPLAGLAVTALAILHRRVAAAGAAAIVIASLAIAQPALMTYAREGAPVFVGFQEMQRALPSSPAPPVLKMHHQVWWGVRRALEWYRPVWDTGLHPFPGAREWLDVVLHWSGGDQRPVWFLGELSRTDLTLFDPRTTRVAGRYEMADRVQTLMGDTRLDEMSWTIISRPRWMLGTGWALTPEIAGVATTDRVFPHQKPAEAYLLRDPRALRVMIGGRLLQGPAGARLTVTLDDAPVDAWTVSADPNWFVRWIDLPRGVPAGGGSYAMLRVHVTPSSPGSGEAVVGLEQFDAALVEEIMWAFDAGWNEPEGNPRTGRLWRWTTDASTLVIKGASTDLKLTIAGESPLASYDAPVEIVVRAGDHEVARFTPTGDFTQAITLPAAQMTSERVTITPARTFVQGERDGGPDRRRLGVRVYSVQVSKQ